MNASLNREIIGLIPAGGLASRLDPLPCSKEVYPVGFREVDKERSVRPKAVCHYLLEKMRLAGAQKAYIVLRHGKWDIPSYLEDGKMLGMNLAYLMMDLPFGVPYTIDQAYPFVKDSLVVFGFPDILFQPEAAFIDLLNRQVESEANLVIGLFPTDKPQKMDMVEIDENGKVRGIQIKPAQTSLSYTWIIAVWDFVFTDFMHNYLADIQKRYKSTAADIQIKESPEIFMGDIIQAGIDHNLHVESVLFSEGDCLDIGTPEDLVKVACGQSQHMLTSNKYANELKDDII